MALVVFTKDETGDWRVTGETPDARRAMQDRRAWPTDADGAMQVPERDVEDFAAELEEMGWSVHV